MDAKRPLLFNIGVKKIFIFSLFVDQGAAAPPAKRHSICIYLFLLFFDSDGLAERVPLVFEAFLSLPEFFADESFLSSLFRSFYRPTLLMTLRLATNPYCFSLRAPARRYFFSS